MTVTINVDPDKKCAECGKGGAVGNGLCLACSAKALSIKPMRSVQGRAVARRMRKQLRESLLRDGCIG